MTITSFYALAALALAAAPLAAQSTAGVLAKLDELAPRFSTATASLTWVDHQAVVDTEERQSGTMAVKRYSGTRTEYIVRFSHPNQYAVALREASVERYTPKNNLIQEYDIRRYRDVAQVLMLLGFGTTGKQMSASFDISGVRAENVGTQRATHLDLAPKSPNIRQQVPRIELWVSNDLGCALQQKFHYPGGSYKLITLTDVKLNPRLDDAALALPRNAKREKVH